MKKLVDFLVYGNIIVALALASLTLETELIIHGKKINYPVVLFIFFSTLLSYNFHRAIRIRLSSAYELRSEKFRWVIKNWGIFVYTSIVAFIGTTFVFTKIMNTQLLWILIPGGLITLSYSLPLIKRNNTFIRLRDIPGIKIFLVSSTITLLTLTIPVVSSSKHLQFQTSDLLWILGRFLFVFAVTIPFDIRDTKYDKEAGLKTIPVVFGNKNARAISISCLLAYTVIVLLRMEWNIVHPYYGIALTLAAMISCSLVMRAQLVRNHGLYTILFEGSLVLKMIFVLIANLLISGLA